MKYQNFVSVIIPAFNEEQNIERCLASISRQSYRNFEVILVDDDSSDSTVIKAEKLSKKLKINFQLVALDVHQERGVIRNIGARKSNGEYLLFIDADMELSPKVLESCVNRVKNSDIKAVIIPEESRGKGFWTDCRTLEKKCYRGDDRIEAARFFDKEAFWAVGGWDEEMISGEDWDLTRRIREKFRVARVSSLIYHHEGRISLLKAAKKKFYYTTLARPYLDKNPLTLKKLIRFGIRPAFIRHWRLLLKNPIHALGLFVLKTAELSAGLLGIIFLEIDRKPELLS